jgi:hypothetical protein
VAPSKAPEPSLKQTRFYPDDTLAASESAPAHITQEYWTEPELAAELNRNVRTLRRWNALRVGPPVTKIGNANFYRKAAVFRWLVRREQKPLQRRSRWRA